MKLHSSLSEDNIDSKQGRSGLPTIGSPNNDDLESNHHYTPFNSNTLYHLVRLAGASIESTVWISWRHLEHFLNYGNALEMSNGFSGIHQF